MSTLSDLWRKQQARWYGRTIERPHQLRRHLAYFVAKHGFEIGDYSIGRPTIRFWNDASRLTIGKYCSVADGVTFILGGNHRTDTVTTFPLGVAFEARIAEEDPYSRGDIAVGSDVWIAGNATILSGVTIGDGAVVGAGAVVIHDVPPYAVVFGNPARVVSKRFSDVISAALLELRWWDLDPAEVQSLRPLLQSKDVESFVMQCRKLKGLPADRKTPQRPFSSVPLPGSRRELVVALLQREHPSFSAGDMDTPFERLGIDSFAMLTLRTALEQSLGATIDDGAWTSIVTPADVVRIASRTTSETGPVSVSAPATARRSYNLNMPHMALGGLSESWLFKELGDIHWGLITRGLRTPSSELQDADGNRLYATFTRFQLNATGPLAAYAENEDVSIDAAIARYGAGMFFSDATVQGTRKSARIRIMSSFSKYGEAGANTSLLKGQPEIPNGCEIPVLADLPDAAQGYRARRAESFAAPLFECEYDILPAHDINGVGLLYFAAYPMINDICAARYAGRDLAIRFSTRSRDVFYFANSDPSETLIYRIHRWNADDNRIEMEGTLSRKSDGVAMASIVTTKERVRQ